MVICLQITTVFWIHGRITCHLLNVHGINVRQTEMHTAEPLIPEPNSFEVEITIEKQKRYKLPGIDQIPAELIQAGGNT